MIKIRYPCGFRDVNMNASRSKERDMHVTECDWEAPKRALRWKFVTITR